MNKKIGLKHLSLITMFLCASGAYPQGAGTSASERLAHDPPTQYRRSRALLVVSTKLLNFSGITGGTNPESQEISIAYTGSGTLTWSATKTQPWLSLSASSGTTPATISISVSTAGLAAGTWTDTVTVNAPGVSGSPASIAVTMVLAAAGPLADWTFDTSTITGNTVLDTSGSGLNASIVGHPVQGSGVNGGQALTFDGSTSYLVTQPDPRPAMTGDLTLAAWIKTTNSSRNETILSKYNSSGSEDGYIFETTAAGYVGIHLGGDNVTGSTNQDSLDGTNKINDGNWHHVAAIIRTGQDISLYVDGGLSSIFYLTTFGGGTGSPVGIAGPSDVAYLFTGSLDDVRIYTRALSTQEIVQLYGGNVTTISGGQILYNGISMPVNFPPPTTPTQALRTPYYINNGPRVLPIDTGRQLFVDDFLIEQTTLLRTQHQPSIVPNPLPIPGSPISAGAWFDPASKLYQLWYYNGVTNDYRYTYSTDGMNWTLPTYPDVLVPNTNEVVTGGDTIWLDQQETNPARRYKSFGVDVGAGLIDVYFSPDGIHWTGPNNYGIVSLSDRTTVFWNPFRKVWVNSDRGTAGFAATALQGAEDTRARFYSESPNLTTWTPATPANTFWTGADDHDAPYYLNNPGGQPPELYTLDAVAYESVMVGLFSWFYGGSGYNGETLPGPVLVELGVGVSRDGFSWVRPTRGSGPYAGGAFIPASDIAGTWNAYNTQSVGGVMLIVGDELWFYFSGRSLQKPLNGTFSTGLATLRRDGFYSMDAGATQGTLVTHPVVFSGSHLFVNVKDPSGQLIVEVLDANGNVIPAFAAANCVPLSANTTMQEVTWTGASIGSLAGQNVQFRFYLTNGSLYSFWVTASAQGASNGYVGAGGPGFTGVTDTVGSAAQP